MTDTQSDTEEQPEHTIASRNRPFPLSAKQALREASEAVVYEEPASPGDPWLAHVDAVPADDVLDRFELTVVREPIEEWRSDSDEHVVIYPDKVVVDGYEAGMSPHEAKEQVRKQSRFTQIQSGDS